MAKGFAKAFYNSKAWKDCRDSYIAERIRLDGGFCEECHLNLGYIVHHEVILTPDNISNPDISLNHAIPWIKLQLDDKKMQMIWEWVNKAVLSAQQTLSAGSGAERKAIVSKFIREMLTAKNISISDEQLDTLIESAVYMMKEGKAE
ncbi:MAG: phage holin family protein [Roseburia sp.]|nr:phage holin family protein [Roseburia sp.]